MLTGIENSLLDFITAVYDTIGWPGIVALMAIESASIPLPSELIMPFAGWKLVEAKGLGPQWVLLVGLLGAIGNVTGSGITYCVGYYGGRPAAEKYGKYVLVSRHDLDLADRFFARWGNWAVFISQLLPVVRTFISVPAGIARMPIWQFVVYTFVGAFIWCLGLALGGYFLGQNYDQIRTVTRPFQYPIVGIIVIAVIWYVYRHVKRAWTPADSSTIEGGP